MVLVSGSDELVGAIKGADAVRSLEVRGSEVQTDEHPRKE